MMAIAHTIIGDLNACGGSTKRRLEEFIESEQLDDIGREEHTHVWGNHRCRIDRVLTRSRGKLWIFEEGWECNSNHTIGATKVSAEATTVESRETDWGKVREWLEKEEERSLEEHTGWEMVADPYQQLRELGKSWTRVVRICAGGGKRMETIEKEDVALQGRGSSRKLQRPKGRCGYNGWKKGSRYRISCE